MAKSKLIKNAFIFFPVNPHPFFHYLFTITPTNSPRNSSRNQTLFSSQSLALSIFISLIVSSALLGIVFLIFSIVPTSHYSAPPCLPFENDDDGQQPITLSRSAMLPLPVHGHLGRSNYSVEETEFWKQPDNQGYKPCLEFSLAYRKLSDKIVKEKRRFLVVYVSGGINQQRNQIVDAVVIARILEAALVVPVLKVNQIWEDESEFSDVFDVDHFRRTLQADVRVVSSLPLNHLISKHAIGTLPSDVSDRWVRLRYSRQLNHEGLLILQGLDSKLSKNLPLDLQKLRCKVAFHALRFTYPIREIGYRLARRMWVEGPYIALHLRVEKDVWVRTGCITGLGQKFDEIIFRERGKPEFVTGASNMTDIQRRRAGLCPLNASEMARLLKALGAPKTARVYAAGGKPFGETEALKPLMAEFPNFMTKEMLARKGELSPFINSSSSLAAIDYIVSLSSDVFLPSHGGNMGRSMQGHRAYVGHRKYIKPNKREMARVLEESSPIMPETQFGKAMRKVHRYSIGHPELRTNKRDRDVIAYPVPECMCNNKPLRATL